MDQRRQRYLRRIRAPVKEAFFPFEAKERADKALDELGTIVEALNLTFFLRAGTCLGIVRDGGYIKGDNDIDVGIISKGKTFCARIDRKRLIKKILGAGFKMGSQWKRHEHWWRYGILFDIHYLRKDEERFLKSFGQLQYNNRTYNAPSPVEKYLKFHYGNWRVPIRIRS